MLNTILNLLAPFNGNKTYLAAAGLVGLAVYQFSTGDTVTAFQSLMAGLGAFGLRHAIDKTTPVPPVSTPVMQAVAVPSVTVT